MTGQASVDPVMVSELTYTADEMMTVAASRVLREGMTCFVGIGLPSAARTWPARPTRRGWC